MSAPETSSPPGTVHPARHKQTRQVLIFGTLAACGVIAAVLLTFGARTPTEPLRSFPVAGHGLLGKPDTGAEIVLFIDYNCPACKDFERIHLPAVTHNLIDTGKAHLYLFQSPFLSESSAVMAGAAQCALNQGQPQFWRYHDLLMKRAAPENAPAPITELRTLAGQARIDVGAWQTCVDQDGGMQQVKADLATHKAVNMVGTPTVFVNGHRTPAGGQEIAQAMTDQAALQENRP